MQIQPPKWIEESHKVIWPQFCNWCSHNGVSLDSKEDYKTWWECFLAGATTMLLLCQEDKV